MSTQIKKTMIKKMMFIAVLLLSLVVAPTSYAVPLTAFGPRDLPIPPGNGFPLWYQDSNGLSIGQCNDPASGFCIFLPDEFFNGANPVFPTNWPAESFYYLLETFAGPLFYRTVIETGFGGLGNPADGQQAVFSRVRFRADLDAVGKTGNYTITHPYGVEVINVPALGPGPDLNQTLDVFGLIALSFNGPLDPSSAVGPFLRAAATPGGAALPFATDAAGNFYLANPAASIAVTGSPLGTNFVEIRDPDGIVIGRIDTFNLQGRVVGNQVTPQTLTFPAQRPGAASAAQTVTVTNISTTAPLTVQVTIDGANAADFTLAADGCSGVAVGPTLTCTFGVVFNGAAPIPAARTASALITTVTPTGMPPMRVALSGTIDSVAPTVILKIPADGQTIPANSAITAVFSEPMLASTITTTTFTVTSGGAQVTASVSYDPADNTATLVPGSQLLPVGAGNTATITTGATDAAGNPLAASVIWSFTTVAADFTAPTVASTSPARNSLGVRLDAPIKVTFDDTMNDLSINNATFTLSNGITGSVSFDAATRTATFTPSAPLIAGTAYTATIKGGAAGVNDWAQNTMAADFQFAFVTNNPPSSPALTSPADGAAGQSTTLTLRWAKAIDKDGDQLDYHIEICENSFFLGPNCGHQDVPPVTAAAPRLNGAYFAGLGGLGMAVIGLVSFGGITGRKRFLMLMIAVLLVSGAAISACGTKTDTETVTVNQPSAAEVTFNTAGLKSGGTVYFWRVEAHDPNGGAAFSETRSFRTQ